MKPGIYQMGPNVALWHDMEHWSMDFKKEQGNPLNYEVKDRYEAPIPGDYIKVHTWDDHKHRVGDAIKASKLDHLTVKEVMPVMISDETGANFWMYTVWVKEFDLYFDSDEFSFVN